MGFGWFGLGLGLGLGLVALVWLPWLFGWMLSLFGFWVCSLAAFRV